MDESVGVNVFCVNGVGVCMCSLVGGCGWVGGCGCGCGGVQMNV